MAGAIIGLYQLRFNREFATDYAPVEARITGLSTTDNDGGLPPRVAVAAMTEDGLVDKGGCLPRDCTAARLEIRSLRPAKEPISSSLHRRAAKRFGLPQSESE